jgi:hypothetical protein
MIWGRSSIHNLRKSMGVRPHITPAIHHLPDARIESEIHQAPGMVNLSALNLLHRLTA